MSVSGKLEFIVIHEKFVDVVQSKGGWIESVILEHLPSIGLLAPHLKNFRQAQNRLWVVCKGVDLGNDTPDFFIGRQTRSDDRFPNVFHCHRGDPFSRTQSFWSGEVIFVPTVGKSLISPLANLVPTAGCDLSSTLVPSHPPP